MIPCLNEEATIAEVVTAVKRYFEKVMVVDDGSTDQTAMRAEKAGAAVLRNATSLGKGAALRKGWDRLREEGFQWAISLDGDGQHAPNDIPAFFRCAEEMTPSLVVGNRMHCLDSMPWVRRAVNRWMSRRLSKATGITLPDSQCGFRLMNLADYSTLQLRTSHFEVESEVLLAFVKAGKRVEFVPIRTIYKAEQSKISPVKDTIRWFRWWWRA